MPTHATNLGVGRRPYYRSSAYRDEKVVHVEKQPESIALFPQLLLKALRFFEKRGNC